MTKVTEPFNTYMFVSDANAPVPVYDVDVSNWSDDDWEKKENALKVANSLFLWHNSDLFDAIGNIEINDNSNIGRTLYYLINGKEWTSGKAFATWNDVLKTNMGWHRIDDSSKSEMGDLQKPSSAASRDLYVVFQSLNNPYTNTNLVLATRLKYGDFTSALKKNQSATNPYWNKKSSSAEGAVKWKNESDNQYLFMLGMRSEHTGKEKKAFEDGGWREAYDKSGAKDGKKGSMRAILTRQILENAFGKNIIDSDNWDTEVECWKTTISDCFAQIWKYATGKTSGFGDITEDGKEWIDKHLCPYYLWSSGERKKNGKFCKYTCTEESIEHIAIAARDRTFNSEPWAGIRKDIYVLLMGEMFSAVSMMKVYYYGLSMSLSSNTSFMDWPASNFVLTKAPTSYVTIDYHNKKPGETGRVVTGSLKIVVLDERIDKDDPRFAIFPDTGGLSNTGLTINVQTSYRSAYYTLTQTNTSEYPVVWKYALHKFAQWYCDNKPYSTNDGKSKKVWGCDTSESRKIVRYVKTFYDNLKKAMPGLMSYRFQNEVFAKFTNHANKSIVDYEDPENTVIAKAIPVMEVSHLKELFSLSFNGSGNFEGGKQFTYSHCIVDLNPNVSEYNRKVPSTLSDKPEFNLGNTQFPMSFADGVNVNVDEYKTKKLVLTRVDKISGEKCDTFTMGSNHNDYDLITDPKKRKYKDDESIVDGAIDDLATVKLGNGGSYQKKHPEVDLTIKDHHILNDDLYDAHLD